MRCAILVSAVVLSATALSAKAGVVSPYVLEVDITNPASLVIRSAGGLSQVTAGGAGYGAFLRGALTGQTIVGVSTSGAISTGSGTPFVGFFANGVDGVSGLGIYAFGNSNITYVQNSPAFLGQVTVDATPWVGILAPVGTIGNVYVRNDTGHNTGQIIGQYRIVPAAPAAGLLGLGGLGGLIATRRRR